jgi:TRAP-type uncharacterized transport system fused permease subunit
LATGNEALTLITATVIVIVLGMGMPTPAVYALAAVLAAPALLALDVPMLPAHLLIVYFSSMSAITPPVAVAAFAAGTIANENPIKIAVVCCRLAMMAFLIPYVFIYNPGILLFGSVPHIILSMVCAAAAMAAFVSTAEGYLFGPISPLRRVLLFIAGALLVLGKPVMALAGGAILLVIVPWIWFSRQSQPLIPAKARARDGTMI